MIRVYILLPSISLKSSTETTFNLNPSESKKAKISRPKKQVWCPNKELAREVLEAVDKYCNPDNALYTHLCSLGLRSSEVSPLKASDFFFNSPKKPKAE